MNITIYFYPYKTDGYVKEHLEKLRLNPQRKAVWSRLAQDIAILQAEGLRSGQIDIKPLGGIHGGLWELRRKFDKINYRIYFVIHKGIFWLIHYLEKKSQTIPQNDANLLKKRSKEAINL